MNIFKILQCPLEGKTLLSTLFICILLFTVGVYCLLSGTSKSGEVTNLDFLPSNLYELLNFKKLDFDGEIYYTLHSDPYGQRLSLYGKLTPETISCFENDPGSLGFELPKFNEYTLKANEFPYPNTDKLPEDIIKEFQFYPDGGSYRTLHNDDLLYYSFGKNRTYIIKAYVFRQSRLCIIFIINNLR